MIKVLKYVFIVFLIAIPITAINLGLSYRFATRHYYIQMHYHEPAVEEDIEIFMNYITYKIGILCDAPEGSQMHFTWLEEL